MDENNNNDFVSLEKKQQEQNPASEAENGFYTPPNGSQAYNNSRDVNNQSQGYYGNQSCNANGANSQGRVPYGQPNLRESDYQYYNQNNGGPRPYQNDGQQPYPYNGAQSYQNSGVQPYPYNGNPYYNPYNDPYAGYGGNNSQGLAIGSLVCGIVGLFTFLLGWIFPVLFILPIVAVILGIVHKSKHLPNGKGLSTAGIVMGIIGTILPIIFLVAAVANLPEMMEYIEDIDPSAYEEFYDEYAEDYPEFFSSGFLD